MNKHFELQGIRNLVVSWQDIDTHGNLTLRAFSNYLQESAWQHAKKLGVGFYELAQEDVFWVLSGLKGEIKKYPKWNDEIQITTWHKGYEGVVSRRDFIITNKDGEQIAAASSDWIIVNSTTHRPVRPQHILDPVAHTVIHEDALKNFEIQIKESQTKNESFHKVLFSELDFNGHANNNRYFEWIANVFEPLNNNNKHARYFGIRFMSECTLNDEITLRYQFSEKTFSIYGVRSNTEKKVFDAQLGF